jgi:hypothetical protein
MDSTWIPLDLDSILIMFVEQIDRIGIYYTQGLYRDFTRTGYELHKKLLTTRLG